MVTICGICSSECHFNDKYVQTSKPPRVPTFNFSRKTWIIADNWKHWIVLAFAFLLLYMLRFAILVHSTYRNCALLSALSLALFFFAIFDFRQLAEYYKTILRRSLTELTTLVVQISIYAIIGKNILHHFSAVLSSCAFGLITFKHILCIKSLSLEKHEFFCKLWHSKLQCAVCTTAFNKES